MPRKTPTSIVLNEFCQETKDELAPVYGLKNIISAGLLLFSRLSDTEQKKAIAELHKMAQAKKEVDEIVSGAEADAARPKRKQARKRARPA